MTVAWAEFEKIRTSIWISQDKIAVANVLESNIEFQQPPRARGRAAFNDRAIAVGKSLDLQEHTASQASFVDHQVWECCGDGGVKTADGEKSGCVAEEILAVP